MDTPKRPYDLGRLEQERAAGPRTWRELGRALDISGPTLPRLLGRMAKTASILPASVQLWRDIQPLYVATTVSFFGVVAEYPKAHVPKPSTVFRCRFQRSGRRRRAVSKPVHFGTVRGAKTTLNSGPIKNIPKLSQ